MHASRRSIIRYVLLELLYMYVRTPHSRAPVVCKGRSFSFHREVRLHFHLKAFEFTMTFVLCGQLSSILLYFTNHASFAWCPSHLSSLKKPKKTTIQKKQQEQVI